jgi:predicted enzyme related to lactoylglutathione lyase
MGRPVMHFEIGCRDKGRTAEFFSKLFDWNTQEMGPAATINTGAGSGINGHITSTRT